jgi:hypothetical protein
VVISDLPETFVSSLSIRGNLVFEIRPQPGPQFLVVGVMMHRDGMSSSRRHDLFFFSGDG